MTDTDKAPSSVEDIKKHFFRKTWILIIKQPLYLKIIFCLAIAGLLVFSARLNFFGDPYYKYSKFIIPIRIPSVDPEQPAISLIYKYEIEDPKGRRTGVLGDNLYSGDRVFLSFKSNLDCWVSVFGVDSRRIFPLWRKNFTPEKIEKNIEYSVQPFELDETTGNEIYYLIASHKKFNFDKSIRPYLRKLFPQGSSKGAVFYKYQMELSDDFAQRFIYFNHLSRP